MFRMFVFTDAMTNLNSIIDGLDYPFFAPDVRVFLLSFSPQAGIQSLNQRLTAPPRRHSRACSGIQRNKGNHLGYLHNKMVRRSLSLSGLPRESSPRHSRVCPFVGRIKEGGNPVIEPGAYGAPAPSFSSLLGNPVP